MSTHPFPTTDDLITAGSAITTAHPTDGTFAHWMLQERASVAHGAAAPFFVHELHDHPLWRETVRTVRTVDEHLRVRGWTYTGLIGLAPGCMDFAAVSWSRPAGERHFHDVTLCCQAGTEPSVSLTCATPNDLSDGGREAEIQLAHLPGWLDVIEAYMP